MNTYKQLDLGKPVYNQVYNEQIELGKSIYNQVYIQLHDQIADRSTQLHDQHRVQLYNRLYIQLDNQLRNQLYIQLRK